MRRSCPLRLSARTSDAARKAARRRPPRIRGRRKRRSRPGWLVFPRPGTPKSLAGDTQSRRDCVSQERTRGLWHGDYEDRLTQAGSAQGSPPRFSVVARPVVPERNGTAPPTEAGATRSRMGLPLHPAGDVSEIAGYKSACRSNIAIPSVLARLNELVR